MNHILPVCIRPLLIPSPIHPPHFYDAVPASNAIRSGAQQCLCMPLFVLHYFYYPYNSLATPIILRAHRISSLACVIAQTVRLPPFLLRSDVIPAQQPSIARYRLPPSRLKLALRPTLARIPTSLDLRAHARLPAPVLFRFSSCIIPPVPLLWRYATVYDTKSLKIV